MYYVHGWHIVVLLYPQRVGFGIAYSVTKGNARASISGISKVADSRASFLYTLQTRHIEERPPLRELTGHFNK